MNEAERVAATVTSVADAYVAEYVERFPDRAELDGIPLERHDVFPDNSRFLAVTLLPRDATMAAA